MNNFTIDSDMETQYTQPDPDEQIIYLLERLIQLQTILIEQLIEQNNLLLQQNSNRDQQNQNDNLNQREEDNSANNISILNFQKHSSNFNSQSNLVNASQEIELECDKTQTLMSFDDEKQSNYSEISIEFREDDDQQNLNLGQKLSQYQIKGILQQFTQQKKTVPHNPIM